MFPRIQRFPRAEFPLALRTGRRFSSPHFSILIPTAGLGYAVVISKKIAKLAVTRHRMKRRIIEALRTTRLPRAAIVFPQASASKMRYDEIVHELTALFEKINHA